jgi:Lon protease-like protein
VERLGDGRYNIVLRGLERFRILREDHARRYRRAQVEPLMQAPLRPEDRDAIRTQRSKLESLLAPAVEKAGVDSRTAAALADEDLVNALAQYLDLDALEKQALLEHDSLRARAESLVELLEMKIMIARTPGVSNVAH